MIPKNAEITPQGIYESIFIALDEYQDRHNGQGPTQITITVRVLELLMQTTFLRYTAHEIAFCGIPVVVTPYPGYHVHLAEPCIQFYEPAPKEPIVLKI